jgi:hypothetical protein
MPPAHFANAQVELALWQEFRDHGHWRMLSSGWCTFG